MILLFYSSHRHWYHHKLTPTVIKSMIAYYKFGVENNFCQICFQNVTTTRFKWKTLLFCDGCNIYLKRCPCGCGSWHKITISSEIIWIFVEIMFLVWKYKNSMFPCVLYTYLIKQTLTLKKMYSSIFLFIIPERTYNNQFEPSHPFA